MAIASYTEDLTDFATGDEATGWSEFLSISYDGQASVTMQDPDYPSIQGLYAAVQQCKKSSAIGSIGYAAGAGTGGHGTDGAYLLWHLYSINQNIDTYVNGGLRVVVGSTYTDFDSWDVGGSDVSPYPYGGWTCHAVNTTITPDDTGGTPNGTEQYIGCAVNVVTGSSKGEPHAVDVIRYGRCSAIFEDGDLANGYCDIAGFSALNDTSTNRWGLLQSTAGGYLWQGRLLFGNNAAGGTAVDFRDSNVTIFIKYTPKVTANFNLIEIQNNNGDTVTSNVEMTGFSFVCLDPANTASKGRLLMTDDADVALLSCTFTDMDTFVFSQTTNTVDITSSTWRRCGQITQGSATFTGCLFDQSTATIALLCADTISTVTKCDFVSSGTGYALEGFSTAGSYTLDGLTFTGYAGVNGVTGNEAVHVTATTGIVTLSIVGGGDSSFSVHTAGATVNIEQSVTLKVGRVRATSDVYIYRADTKALLASAFPVSVTDFLDGGIQYYKLEYTYNASVLNGVAVEIKVLSEPYENIRQDYTLTNADASVNIFQRTDRNYENPD